MFSSPRLFNAVVSSTQHVRQKATTGLTGIKVHPNPLPTLHETYSSNLQLVRSIPETALYRQSLEALLAHKLNILQNTLEKEGSGGAGIARVEKDIGDGQQIEEILMAAEDELSLTQKMLQWKVYAFTDPCLVYLA
jgi:NADH dehydrogenase (ubiquinone) 1 alpha subcomplex subunit 5